MTGYTREEMRQGWERAERLLRIVYNDNAPRGSRGKKIPAHIFAKFTRKQVDAWDFPSRHMMHKIAKALNR